MGESDQTLIGFPTNSAQDDGVIPPSHTRKVLGLSLMASLGGKNEPVDTKFGVFRM
jgi:hypothetical protein